MNREKLREILEDVKKWDQETSVMGKYTTVRILEALLADPEAKKEPEGFEPYIPSVHLKNVAPLDWLESEDGKEFLKKLIEFEKVKELLKNYLISN